MRKKKWENEKTDTECFVVVVATSVSEWRIEPNVELRNGRNKAKEKGEMEKIETGCEAVLPCGYERERVVKTPSTHPVATRHPSC
jgi:hypothetical protein